MNYSEIRKSDEYLNDDNCCTVVASAVAFDMTFQDTQKFYDEHGRKRNKGYRDWAEAIIDIAKLKGYELERYCIRYTAKGWALVRTDLNGSYNKELYEIKTYLNSQQSINVSNWKTFLPVDETYIFDFCGSIRHVAGVKNGKVEDWTDGRRYAVNSIFKITKKENVKNLTKNQNPFAKFGL